MGSSASDIFTDSVSTCAERLAAVSTDAQVIKVFSFGIIWFSINLVAVKLLIKTGRAK